MRIPQLNNYRNRNPHGPYFDDLPFDAQQRAYQWLHRFVTRRKATHGGVEDWLLPIYVGKARHLALTTPEERSKWGRSMLGKRGGLAVQRRYQLEGRNPTARATLCRVVRQRARKQDAAEESMRATLGLPPPPRESRLLLD
jgi:hypothetical protein